MTQPVPVILAGGQGTRFWPAGRKAKPKQFLSITQKGLTLLQQAVQRSQLLSGNTGEIFVVTGERYQEQILEQVQDVEVIAEPIGRNTAPALGLAAFALLDRFEDPVMVVQAADHVVRNKENFQSTMESAIALASEHRVLVTVGIRPEFPNTAYGYIEQGNAIGESGYQVQKFHEKPDAEKAKGYCDSGKFFWNSGMFVWKAGVFLDALERYLPDMYRLLKEARGYRKLGKEDEVSRVFESIESISVDHGVLERVDNAALVIAEDIGWNDVGSWDAWAKQLETDANGNVVSGEAIVLNSKNSVVRSGGRFVAVCGVEDIVVVDSEDAVLVCKRDQVQDIKNIVEYLQQSGREDLL